MDSRHSHAAALVLGLLSAAALPGPALAQTSSAAPAAPGTQATPWAQGQSMIGKQADAWFENYKFRDSETLDRLKIHYATLGTPHRNASGDIDNAVMVLHWTGADSRALLSPIYMRALFDPGRPLDAMRYYLIFPIVWDTASRANRVMA